MVRIVVPAVRMDQERGCDRDGLEKLYKWIRMTGGSLVRQGIVLVGCGVYISVGPR